MPHSHTTNNAVVAVDDDVIAWTRTWTRSAHTHTHQYQPTMPNNSWNSSSSSGARVTTKPIWPKEQRTEWKFWLFMKLHPDVAPEKCYCCCKMGNCLRKRIDIFNLMKYFIYHWWSYSIFAHLLRSLCVCVCVLLHAYFWYHSLQFTQLSSVWYSVFIWSTYDFVLCCSIRRFYFVSFSSTVYQEFNSIQLNLI